MFLAHAPAGLLASRILGRSRAVMLACVAGALFPDVDMLWFHAVDHGQVHHHRYWTHLPLFWAALAPVALALAGPRWRRVTGAFLLGVASHLALDTVVGDVAWLLPFSDRFVRLVEVPRREGWWVWSFALHWTFAFELALTALGMRMAWRELSPTCSRVRSPSTCSASSARSTSPASPGSSGA